MTTTIYLVKHADELKENGIKNINDTTQIMNEKYILSVKGEEQSKKLSESPELNNIDVLWSSSYARAKATAKYIADRNNIEINIDSRLNERKLGNLEDLAKWMENKKYGVVQAYLQDKKWKAREGESCEEATKRHDGNSATKHGISTRGKFKQHKQSTYWADKHNCFLCTFVHPNK